MNPAEQITKKVEQLQTPPAEAGEVKRARAIDLKTLGTPESSEMPAGAWGQGGKLVLERVTLPPDRHVGSGELQAARGKYGQGAETLSTGGRILNEKGDLEEEFKKSYVELPDGSIRTARVDARFPDGGSESLVRDLDTEGRIRGIKNIVNGKVVAETKYAYGPGGEVSVSEYTAYDEAGKVMRRTESSLDPSGKVAVRGEDRSFLSSDTRIDPEKSLMKFQRARAYGGFEDGS